MRAAAAGSIYVTQCTNCTFYVGSRQLRIHTSRDVDFYVHANSHPIIEHCSSLRFAPYPPLPPAYAHALAAAGLRSEHNQWDCVDDFDWLKASHSPNWAELPEGERKPPPADVVEEEGTKAEAEVADVSDPVEPAVGK